LASSRVGAAATIVARSPPNDNEFCTIVVAKPRPKTSTVVPIAPADGANIEIATAPGVPVVSKRSILRMLPKASYVYVAALPC
jgi:hypothetical protein